MSAKQPIDLELADGVLSFDGRVVEFFGFIYDTPMRIHVLTIKKLEYKKNDLKITSDSGQYGVASMSDEDEPHRGDFEGLIDQIRAASTNVEAS